MGQQVRLPVVLAHADLQPAGHHAADLESEHLAEDRPMLDDDLGAASLDGRHQGPETIGGWRFGRQPGRLGQGEGPAGDPPDAGLHRERARPPGQVASRVVLDQHMQLVDLVAAGPTQCTAEGPRRLVVDQHPSGPVIV